MIKVVLIIIILLILYLAIYSLIYYSKLKGGIRTSFKFDDKYNINEKDDFNNPYNLVHILTNTYAQKDYNLYSTDIVKGINYNCDPYITNTINKFLDDLESLNKQYIKEEIIIPLIEAIVALKVEFNKTIEYKSYIGHGSYHCVFKIYINDDNKDAVLRLKSNSYIKTTLNNENKYVDIYNENNEVKETISKNINALNNLDKFAPEIYYSPQNNQIYENYDTICNWYVMKLYSRIDTDSMKEQANVEKYAESMIDLAELIHSKNLIFFDWKLDNIMYDDDKQQYVLVDFELLDKDTDINNKSVPCSHRYVQILKMMHSSGKCALKPLPDGMTKSGIDESDIYDVDPVIIDNFILFNEICLISLIQKGRPYKMLDPVSNKYLTPLEYFNLIVDNNINYTSQKINNYIEKTMSFLLNNNQQQ